MKALTKYLLFTGLLFLAASCFDEPGTDILLDNVAEIEIQQATTSGGLDVAFSYLKALDGLSVRDSIRVNLVGPQKSTPINVSFTIDATSTAVAGVHYDLVTTNTVVIPANSSYGYIYFNVLDDNIEAGELWKVKFNLTAADGGATLSPSFSTFTRSIRAQCPFIRADFVGSYSTLEPGYGTYTNIASADGTNVNAVRINNFWDFGGNVQYVFNPNSANPTVTLPTQSVVMGGVTYTVSQNGAASYDPCTGNFIVPYRVANAGGTTLDTNTHTFTKD